MSRQPLHPSEPTCIITLRIPAGTLNKIEQLADNDSQTVSETIRDLIGFALDILGDRS